MAKVKPNLLRKHDLAKVVVPQRFIRCGYKMNVRLAVAELRKTHTKEIREFLLSIGITKFTKLKLLSDTYELSDDRIMNKFMDGLGYIYNNSNGFGGKTRKIFSEYDEVLDGATVGVVQTAQVMTGTYIGPSGGYDSYNGEYWSESGGLEDRKSNRIVKVNIVDYGRNYPLSLHAEHPDQQWSGLWIEGSNCEKISEDASA